MKKFAPFLKLYTEYVKNFENANTVVTQWAEKSNKFAAFLKEVQVGIPAVIHALYYVTLCLQMY